MAEDDLFSQLAVTVTKLQCKISQLENKCRNQVTYQQELISELDKERTESKRLCKNIEDLISQEKLLRENIMSIQKSKAAAEEGYSDLNNQLAVEVAKTKQFKINQDETLQKYTSRWEKYLEIYNSLPLAQEKNKLSFALKAKDIEVNLVKQNILEAKNKLNKMKLIKEKIDQISVKNMAETYKKYNYEVKKKEQLLCKLREVKTQIEQIKLEKATLLGSTENKIDAVKGRADSLAWSYPGIKKGSAGMNIGKNSPYFAAFHSQKLKILELTTTPPLSLDFSVSNNARRGLHINNCSDKTLNSFNKQQIINKSNHFMEKSKIPYNLNKCEVKDKHTTQVVPPKTFENYTSIPNKHATLVDPPKAFENHTSIPNKHTTLVDPPKAFENHTSIPNKHTTLVDPPKTFENHTSIPDKHTTQVDPPKTFENHTSIPNKQSLTDEKQNQMQGCLLESKPKENQENYKLVLKLQPVDRKVTYAPQNKEKIDIKEHNNPGEKISFKVKSLQNTTTKKPNQSIHQMENQSVVINVSNALTNSKAHQIDLNTPLRSLLDKANLKRQHENNNYSVTPELLHSIKSKYKPINLLQTVDAKINLKENQNENIVHSYQSLTHGNILSELKSISGSKMPKQYSEVAQQENKEQSKEISLKNCEENPQSPKVQEEIKGLVQSPPDLLLTQTTKVLSQEKDQIGSQELLTPSALDEAERAVFMKIAEESPGYQYDPDAIIYRASSNNDLSQMPEPGEQSHYFMNPMFQNTQDEHSGAHLPSFSYSPPPGSYLQSPPGKRPSDDSYDMLYQTAEKQPSDNPYIFSPPRGQSFGDVNFTSSKPNDMPLFGFKKGGDAQDKEESKKTDGNPFNFSNEPKKSSIFNMF